MEKGALYRILETLKLSGVETVDIAFTSTGDYFAVKNKKYDELVGAIINIGEQSTNISIFNKGIQIKNGTLPVGSVNVDKDITYVFKAKPSEAREMKENFAMALANYADSNDKWEITIDKDTNKEVHQLGVSKIVEARVREILKLAKNEIKNLTNREIRYIIITGGLSELAGFNYLVEQEFGFVAKVCDITNMGIRHNKYSSCYGITKYFDDKLALRDKHYKMISDDDRESMLVIDSNVTKETMFNKVFGHFDGNN
jgi:cell division protein FtsA